MAEKNKRKGEFVNISNPYTPNELESAQGLYHEEVIEQIVKIVELREEDRIIVLIGNPGSGKTSTLKRIKKSPKVLEKNYIPVYLDSRKYKVHDSNDLLFSVQKDIVEELIKLGKDIARPDYFRKRQANNIDNTLKTFLLNIDSVIDTGSTLLLIFDEFDSLVKLIDDQTISRVIEKFKQIERNWSNYALILAANKKFHNTIASMPFNKLLNTAYQIQIEDVLDEERIKKLIINPVGDQLNYNEEALQEIIWLSGKNLYFQQLICFNLVNYLNEAQKNQCSKQDVEQTVQRVLSEERPEFEYAWNNILTMESRLIASALADKRITKEGDKYHLLKENSILDDIFGDELYEMIAKLEDFGYLNKIKGRRFSRYPFRIPLYGRWVQKEHPFIKTIIEHIEKITDKIDLKKLIEAVKEADKKELRQFDKAAILEIANKWRELKDSILREGHIAERRQIEDFSDVFSRRLKVNIKEKYKTSDNYFTIDMKSMGIGIIEEAFCIVQDRPELAHQDIDYIEQMAGVKADEDAAQTKLMLFFYFQPSEKVEDLVKKPYLNLVTIDENALKRIILSESPRHVFKEIILSKIALHKISPYRTAGPAKATFYGRSKIINEIAKVTNNSFAIVGARRIGKTSLLHKIKENPPPNTIYIFMDLETMFSSKTKNYRKFIESLRDEIEETLGITVDFGILSFGRELSKLPGIIKQLAGKKKKIVFIFDEVDSLIEFDKKHGYKLLRIFRTLSQKNYCQFIFAGFKELYHQKRGIENPQYNLYEETRLKPLEEDPALDLITKPMESIGIHYKNPEDRELILEYTGRHPNLLQFFCKQLIETVEKHQKVEDRRTVFKKDILEVFDRKYEDYIMDDVYMFFSDLSDINILILILLVENPSEKNTFSVTEIKNKLTQAGIRIPIQDVYRNIKNLVMRFILVDEGGDKYSFALSVFPDILKKRYDEDYKNNLIKEIKENVSKSV
jgi:GTPase SAR1 family protein